MAVPETHDGAPAAGRWFDRSSGAAALAFAAAYVVIIALYVPLGAAPSDPLARLEYHGAHLGAWWAILTLSVLTDLLLIPVTVSAYARLAGSHRRTMTVAVAFVALFVVLDLAVTWTNYAAVLTLSDAYATADAAQRAAVVAAARYPASLLGSTLLFVYNSLTLSVGILITGLVMRRSGFRRPTGYLGIATGAVGVIAVVGSLLLPAIGSAIILASLLTLLWVAFVGVDLLRPAPATG
ncbi:hypothetical protein [Raineyella sp. W15-4]|uniref:hypothetical protein n=1 Tax=Raineyella sp. W15-4 TaxID=3081651 RepID=UPI002955B650|nr:hypothetical protein [Raineyella sp. W15-4]WOQ17663.1 hypothetical protein R0145_02830 [Raineyella sp. W15-4]